MKVNFDTFIQALDGIDDSFILEAADDSAVKAAFKKENKRAVNIRFTLKRLMLVAVVLVGMVAMGMVAGSRLSNSDALNSFGKRILDLDVGESTEWHSITIINSGDILSFETVEEFFENTDYDVLYPSVLPEGLEIIKVAVKMDFTAYGDVTPDHKSISYFTSNPYSYTITMNMHKSWIEKIRSVHSAEMETVNGFECYFYDRDKAKVGCFLIHEDITYTIQAPTEEEVIAIINGMKKYEQ